MSISSEIDRIEGEVNGQSSLIDQIKTALDGKAANNGGTAKEEQQKNLDITENGTYNILPDSGKVLSKATVNVEVPDRYDEGYNAGVENSKPTLETLTVTENGTYTPEDGVDGFSEVIVEVPTEGGVTPDYQTKYQRIEYIESTTGCKIVTDIIANNGTGMELVAKYPTLADRVPMGSRSDESASRFYIPYPLSTQTIYHGFNSGKSNTAYPAANVKYRAALNFLNNRCSFTKEEDTNTVKYTVALTEALTQQECPIGIFCYLRGEAATAGSSREFTFYSARISQGNDVVREYIPCYRKSDGEIGLYEKYTGQFLVNEGSGTFTKGADIEWDTSIEKLSEEG